MKPMATRLRLTGLAIAVWFVTAGSAQAVNYGELVPDGVHLPVGQVIGLDDQGKVTGWGTGTLIEKDVVLTAAHVVFGVASPAHLRFKVNSEPAIIRKIIAVQFHPRYFNRAPTNDWPAFNPLSSDLAVLRLDQPLPDSVGTYSLINEPLAPGTIVTAVGFGINESKQAEDARKMSGQLKFVTHKDHQMICASLEGNYQRTDSGDSGGPLMIRKGDQWHVVATVRGKRLFESVAGYAPDEYGDYISVYRHRTWILHSAESLREIPYTPTYVYLKRPADSTDPTPQMTLRQLEGMTRAGTPDQRVFGRALSRGIGEPLPEKILQIMKGPLRMPETLFIGLQVQPSTAAGSGK
jgi:hypothetical protein